MKLNKNKVLSQAKELSPDIIRVTVEENKNKVLGMKLRWKNFPVTIELRKLLWMDWGNYTKRPIETEIYDFVMNKIKSNIQEGVLKFGKKECDILIDKFNLKDKYKDEYEDKNIMYKVKHDYERKFNGSSITKNLDFYYYDEVKVLLPYLFYFWILMIKRQFNHKSLDAIEDMVYSIIEHLKQVFLTYDIIKNVIKEAKHFGNPDTFFVFYYHFTYFISLIKTVADNICWIVNLYLKLNIDHFNLDILDSKFENIIKNNRNFYKVLYFKGYYNEYEKLDNFRDIIQHRHIIRSMRVVSKSDGKNKIVIPKDPETIVANSIRKSRKSSRLQTQKIAEDPSAVIRYGLHEYVLVDDNTLDEYYVNPIEFCETHVKGICDIANSVFERIVDEKNRQLIGKVTKFYPKLSVATLELLGELRKGNIVIVEGKTTSFKQKIECMEIDHKSVENCNNGLVAIKLDQKVRVNDKVYLIKKIDHSTFLNFNFI
jgi:putative protease